ncbi:hypothetical protein AS202_10560 [Myroides odoratimimus]|uniref:Uncharacterized protein n=1 Tax=Myroides odoratimimus TaxID=76832 RepID=A0AAI8C5N4_9FLAO|nr:hypothetical protein AS202_10560 [Myroides odoratimimus]
MIDAYVEKDSRKFMGGLPRWEYIIHLLVNGFHFASIAVFIVIKVDINYNRIILNSNFQQIESFKFFNIIALNLLPGAIIISLLHILVYNKQFNYYFNKIQLKCC